MKRLVFLVSMAALLGALLLAGVAAALVLPSDTHKKCRVRSAKTHLVSAKTHTVKTTAKTGKKATAASCRK